MGALWVCTYEELERSNWNDPEIFSPSGLPGHTAKRQEAEGVMNPAAGGRVGCAPQLRSSGAL